MVDQNESKATSHPKSCQDITRGNQVEEWIVKMNDSSGYTTEIVNANASLKQFENNTLFFFIRTSFFFRRLHVLIFEAK